MLLRPSSGAAARSPTLRTSTLSCSSVPTGTSSSGTLGMTASASSSALSSSRSRRLAVLDEALDLGDLGLQRLGQRRVLGAHGLADLLRGGVAALLRFLQLDRDGRGAPRRWRSDSSTVACAASAASPRFTSASARALRVLANPFDVEHGRIPIHDQVKRSQRASCRSRAALASQRPASSRRQWTTARLARRASDVPRPSSRARCALPRACARSAGRSRSRPRREGWSAGRGRSG